MWTGWKPLNWGGGQNLIFNTFTFPPSSSLSSLLSHLIWLYKAENRPSPILQTKTKCIKNVCHWNRMWDKHYERILLQLSTMRSESDGLWLTFPNREPERKVKMENLIFLGCVCSVVIRFLYNDRALRIRGSCCNYCVILVYPVHRCPRQPWERKG